MILIVIGARPIFYICQSTDSYYFVVFAESVKISRMVLCLLGEITISDTVEIVSALIDLHFFIALVVMLIKHVLSDVHAVTDDFFWHVFGQEMRDRSTADVVG